MDLGAILPYTYQTRKTQRKNHHIWEGRISPRPPAPTEGRVIIPNMYEVKKRSASSFAYVITRGGAERLIRSHSDRKLVREMFMWMRSECARPGWRSRYYVCNKFNTGLVQGWVGSRVVASIIFKRSFLLFYFVRFRRSYIACSCPTLLCGVFRFCTTALRVLFFG